MRRTFCARCHTIGLSRCAHPTRSSGPGGKHRARETYRVHPARTFVDVPTSPFLFSAATTTQDALPDSFTTLTSTRVATDESDEQFTTLMHELWSAPSEPVGDLPEGIYSMPGQVDYPAWMTLIGITPNSFQVIVGNPPLLSGPNSPDLDGENPDE